MRSSVLVGVFVAFCACATTSAPPPAPPTSKPEPDAEAIPDVYDKCPAIIDTCISAEDLDGCPDELFSVGDRCLARPQDAKEIDSAAAQMLGNPRIGVLELVSSDQACASRFFSRFVLAGVAPTRLRIRIDRAVTGLVWKIVLFDGKPC